MTSNASQTFASDSVFALKLELAQARDDWHQTVLGEDKFKQFQLERMQAAVIADREDSARQFFLAKNFSGEKFIR